MDSSDILRCSQGTRVSTRGSYSRKHGQDRLLKLCPASKWGNEVVSAPFWRIHRPHGPPAFSFHIAIIGPYYLSIVNFVEKNPLAQKV